MAAREESISKRSIIPEEEETECVDDLWDYIKAHEDEIEDPEEYAKKRGLKNLILKVFAIIRAD
jgi:hypothetical protein